MKRFSQMLTVGATLMMSSSAQAVAAPALTVTPIVGHPKIATTVSGTGFTANEAVDVYFDTTDKFLAVTNGSGSFPAQELDVPKDALPGSHWVTAVGRKTGDASHTSFLVRTNWPQYGFDVQHRGRNPYENVIDPSNVGTLDVAWSFFAPPGIWSSAAYNAGVIYVGSFDDKVYALTATGHVKWSATTGGAVRSSPSVARGNVYVGSFDGKVYAFNASTGAPVWSTSTGAVITGSPTVVGNSLYIGSNDGKVSALNATTGAALWSAATGGAVEYLSPAVANGIVYIGSDDNKLYALDAGTGAVVWTIVTGSGIYSSPTVAGGAVYFGSLDNTVYAVDAKTGAAIWSYATTGSVGSSPAVVNNTVFIASDNGNLYALDAGTGVPKWVTPVGIPDLGSVTIANGVGYIGAYSTQRVYAFSLDVGHVLWSARTASVLEARPTVADGKLYIGSLDGTLYAYALDGGNNAAYKPRLPPSYASLHPDRRLREVSKKVQ